MVGKKKRTSSHGSDDDDGKWKIFRHFFLVGNDLRDDVLTLLSKPNVMSVVVGAFASGRHYLRIYGSGAGVVGPT